MSAIKNHCNFVKKGNQIGYKTNHMNNQTKATSQLSYTELFLEH